MSTRALALFAAAVVILLMAVSLWRGVREDWNEEQRQEKRLRRWLREIAAQDARE